MPQRAERSAPWREGRPGEASFLLKIKAVSDSIGQVLEEGLQLRPGHLADPEIHVTDGRCRADPPLVHDLTEQVQPRGWGGGKWCCRSCAPGASEQVADAASPCP